MLKKQLKKISWILTVSIVFSVFACLGTAVPALAESQKVYTFNASENVISPFKADVENYTDITYSTAEYDGSKRNLASFTLSGTGAANTSVWNKREHLGIVYNTNNAANNWGKVDLGNYSGGYVRVWINSPKALDFSVAFQDPEPPYSYFIADVSLADAQAGKLSYVDVAISDFHEIGGNITESNGAVTGGVAPAMNTGKFVVTCRRSDTVWLSAGETMTLGNVEIWDGVPTDPVNGGDNYDVTYGKIKDKLSAVNGIYSAEKSGQLNVNYLTDASYNSENGMTAAVFTVADGSAERTRAAINPRGETAGYKNWYIYETDNWIRLWIKAETAATVAVAAQESENYFALDYTYNLKASEAGKFIAIDIPVSAYASLIKDETSAWRFNKFFINVVKSSGEKLTVGESFTLGQIELWDGRPEPVKGSIDDDTYTVTTASNGAFGTATGGGTFKAGETAHLLADAASGYHFVKWVIGGVEYKENPLDYTVNSDVTATAVFEPNIDVEPVKLLSIPCVAENMRIANGTGGYWAEPEYYDVTTSSFTGKSGKFTVLEDVNISEFYNDWAKSRTGIMYIINDYGSIDFASYASTGAIRIWVRVSKPMTLMAGAKISEGSGNYPTYCVKKSISEDYVGKFVAVDIPFSALTEQGWNIQSHKAVEIGIRRADDATADNGYYLTAGESIELGAAELWSALPPISDPLEKYTVTTTVNNEEAGTVSGAGEYEYAAEAALSAKAKEGSEFVGWIINGKLVSEADTSVTVNCDMEVKAIFRDVSEHTVTFRDVVGNIVDIKTVENGKTVSSLPKLPDRYGYSVTGWKDFTVNTAVMADIEVIPVFEKTVSVTVTVDNGTVSSEDTKAAGEAVFDFEETVTAMSTDENFAYWSINGVKVSSANPYIFYASENVKLTAVSGETAEANSVYIDTRPKVVRQDNGMYSITFIASTDLADGAAVKDAGFIMASGDQRGNSSEFVIYNHEVSYKKIVVDTSANQQFMFMLTDVPENYIRSVRAYAVIDNNGITETLYSSAIVKAKASEASEETILDSMVINSNFLNGLTEEEVAEFCENGWYYQPQNNDRLIAAMQKAQAGGTVTLAFLGGSITTGSNSGRTETSGTDGSSRDKLLNAWHRYVLEWWETTFPQATINYVVAGEAGTGSTFAVYRLKYQVLSYKPDVVFNDSAANEGGADIEKECFESVLRAILSQDNAPAVVDLGMAFETGTNSQGTHRIYCSHYGVPIISFQDSIKAAISAGQTTWATISNDNVHPNMDGHKIVGDLLNYYLTSVYLNLPSDSVVPEKAIPESLTSARFTDAEILNRDTVDSCSKVSIADSSGMSKADTLWGVPDMSDQPYNYYFYSNQARNQGWKLSGEGAYMEFNVTAREFKITYADNGNTTDSFDIYIDNEYKQTVTGTGNWAQNGVVLWDNKSGDSTHTVKIVVKSGNIRIAHASASSWNG